MKPDELPEYQHRPPKKKNYRERLLAGEVEQKPRKPLKTKSKLRRERRLNNLSKKGKKRYNAYRNRCKKWRKDEAYQICKRCTTRENIEFHHPSGRYGKNIFFVIPLCHTCHAWVHENMNKALELGYITDEYRRKS